MIPTVEEILLAANSDEREQEQYDMPWRLSCGHVVIDSEIPGRFILGCKTHCAKCNCIRTVSSAFEET